MLSHHETDSTNPVNHVLIVSQQIDGSWKIEIRGPKSISHGVVFDTADEAKLEAHSLAHWHLEEKKFCDCRDQPAWSEEES
jgi:hypothetical protein